MANLLFGVLFVLVVKSSCYKPVIIVHGILDHASDLEDLASFITQAHPGTNITLIKLYEELDSFAPLWTQVSAMTEKIRAVMQYAKDGVHIIGFSQGIMQDIVVNNSNSTVKCSMQLLLLSFLIECFELMGMVFPLFTACHATKLRYLLGL